MELIGRKEMISFPQLQLLRVPAKVDTGAYRSSIHCSKVKEIVKDGQSLLQVVFLGKMHPQFVKSGQLFSDYKKVKVRSSNGEMQERYMVKAQIALGKRKFKTEFTLTNRSAMKTPVLLGRKALRERFLVDVSKSYLLGK